MMKTCTILQSWSLFAAFAFSAHAATLHFPRDATTCSSTPGLSACPAGINFCCPSSYTCMGAGTDNSTVVCCPNGRDCSALQPVTCDITQFNATLYPLNLLHTSDLGTNLSTCNGTSTCCPPGYSCQGNNCIINNKASSSTSAGALPTATSTPAVVVPSGTAAPSADGSSEPQQTSSNPFPPGAVILGLFLGLLVGVLAAIGVMWCLRRRKQRRSTQLSPDFMGKTPTLATPPVARNSPPMRPAHSASNSTASISQPILMEQLGGNNRTDFLRRGDSKSGFERKNKPLWSKFNDGPGSPFALSRKSFGKGTSRKLVDATVPNGRPFTPPSQASIGEETPKRKSMALFVKPLRLPTNYQTAQQKGQPKPGRPLRSDEEVPKLASPAFQMANGSSRALVEDDALAKGSSHRAGHSRTMTSASVESTSSIESDDSVDTPEKQIRKKDASSETINVLMPPPALFSQGRRDPNRQTTFTEMMERAGCSPEQKRH